MALLLGLIFASVIGTCMFMVPVIDWLSRLREIGRQEQLALVTTDEDEQEWIEQTEEDMRTWYNDDEVVLDGFS